MEEMILPIAVGVLVGVALKYITSIYIKKIKEKKAISEVKKQVSKILKEAKIEAESIKKAKILESKEKIIELKSEHQKAVLNREKNISDIEKRITYKEVQITTELDKNKRLNKNLEYKKLSLEKRLDVLEKKELELEKKHDYQIELLEQISDLSAEKAKKELVTSLKDKAKTEAMAYVRASIEEAKLTAEQEARKVILGTIQRVGVEQSIDNCVSVFNIESDDVKGRIIGREGRNIRVLEATTGVEIIVDDTPEAIILSCFDPIRREIARLAMQKLVTDGRIHPAVIEDVVRKTRSQIMQEINETGKRTAIDLGIHGLHPQLVKTIGRMKYRSSYGQNLLQHSREVSNLCGIMASEMGLNSKMAKRAGLLHDIGKVPEAESELTHAILGMQWAEKYGEKKEVCNAIGAHHDEIEMNNLISPIVQVCDAISGARPGARRQALDSYIQRLKDLEEIAYGFSGVQKAYAIQAGRELRVIVESDKVSDTKAKELSYNISQKIQNTMTYPGQVKITVIREIRSVNIAK